MVGGSALLLGLIGLILYLVLRGYKHLIKETIEISSETVTINDMETPSFVYDTSKRGYRNNNPLNIVQSDANKWKGEVLPSQDKRFCTFKTMAYGFRAALVCIRTYITKRNCKTLQEVINRWAPWKDGNNPVNYAQHICNTWPELFTDSDVAIDPTSKEQMTKLIYAMAIVENGKAPDMSDCEQGFDLM